MASSAGIPGFASRAVRCRPSRGWEENGGGVVRRDPGIHIPGCTMSPLSGLGRKMEMRHPQGSRDSHPGLYDVAPLGAGTEDRVVRRDPGIRIPGCTMSPLSGLGRKIASSAGIPGFTSRAVRCRPSRGWEEKWRWRRPQGSRDSHPGLYDVAPLGAGRDDGGVRRDPGIHIPGFTISPLSGLGEKMEVASSAEIPGFTSRAGRCRPSRGF